jgi:hypothetical protein
MNKPVFLVSTHNGRTFMITSYEPKTLVVFEDPIKEVDANGNTLLYYSTIQIRKM